MPKKTMTFEDAMLRLREVTETLEKGRCDTGGICEAF